MKSKLLLLLVPFMLIGSGDNSELELRMEHELAMEREKTHQVASANQVANTYIENEYEYEVDSGFEEHPSVYSGDTETYSATSAQVPTVHSVGENTSTDSGYSGTTVATAALAGAAVGHLATKNSDKIKDTSKQVATTTKEKVKQIQNSPKTQKLKDKTKYQARKAKVLAKKAAKKAKRKLNGKKKR